MSTPKKKPTKRATKRASPKPAPAGVMEVTETDVIRWGLSRARAKAACAKLTPMRADRRQRVYDCGQVVMALMDVEASPSERRELAQAELAEEKLRRMKGESIERVKVRDLVADLARLMVETIKAFPEMSEKSRQALLKSMREGAERLGDDLDSCKFSSAEEAE